MHTDILMNEIYTHVCAGILRALKYQFLFICININIYMYIYIYIEISIYIYIYIYIYTYIIKQVSRLFFIDSTHMHLLYRSNNFGKAPWKSSCVIVSNTFVTASFISSIVS